MDLTVVWEGSGSIELIREAESAIMLSGVEEPTRVTGSRGHSVIAPDPSPLDRVARLNGNSAGIETLLIVGRYLHGDGRGGRQSRKEEEENREVS